MALSADLKTEFENAYVPGYDLFTGMAEPEDETLRETLGWDYREYERLRRDGHVEGILVKRELGVVAKELKVKPADESKPADVKMAKLLERQLEALNFDRVTYSGLDALLKGFSGQQLIWTIKETSEGKRTWIEEMRPESQNAFVFRRRKPEERSPDHHYIGKYEVCFRTERNIWMGEPVPPKKFFIFSYGSRTDNPYGKGLGNLFWWMVKIKKELLKSGLIHCDKFASPTAIVEYASAAQTENARKAQEFLASIVQKSSAALPEGFKASLLEASRGGSADIYINLFHECNYEMSKSGLGGTLGLEQQGGTGSKSATESHQGGQELLDKATADLFCAAINRGPATWLRDLNDPSAGVPIVYRDFEVKADEKAEAEKDKTKVDTAKTMFDMGWRFNKTWVKENLGDNWEPVTAGDTPQEEPLVSKLGVGGTQSLIDVVKAVSVGEMPRESAIAVLTSVFGVEESEAAAMIPEPQQPAPGAGELEQPGAVGGEPPTTPGAEVESIFASLSEEVVDLAAKKRNCQKGKPCKGTCIAQSRTCRDQLNPQEQEQVKAIKQGAGGGGDSQSGAAPTSDEFTNQAELDKLRQRVAKHLGEDFVSQVESNVQNVIDDADIFVRVPSNEILEKIVSDRFKSQFETSSSKGILDTDTRSDLERKSMNYAEDSDPAMRPIYGYYSKGPTYDGDDSLGVGNPPVQHYGGIAVKMKSEVKDRATMSLNDSLDTDAFVSSARKVQVASMLNEDDLSNLRKLDKNPNDETARAALRDRMQAIADSKDVGAISRNTGTPYVEAQIHRQAKASDIDEIVFPEGTQPSSQVRDWAAQNNVKISFMNEKQKSSGQSVGDDVDFESMLSELFG